MINIFNLDKKKLLISSVPKLPMYLWPVAVYKTACVLQNYVVSLLPIFINLSFSNALHIKGVFLGNYTHYIDSFAKTLERFLTAFKSSPSEFHKKCFCAIFFLATLQAKVRSNLQHWSNCECGKIVDFGRFLCEAAAILGNMTDNAINGSLLDTLVPKLKKKDKE